MAGFSKYLAQAVFNMTLNPSKAAYSPPANVYLGLHTSATDDISYGTECSYSGYNRVVIPNMTSSVVAGDTAKDWNIRAKNTTALVFQASSGPTETVTHWAIWDSATPGTGNILYSGAAATSRVVQAGDSLVIQDGQLVVDIK